VAFATGGFNDEDLADYAQTRERTRIEYVSENETLHIVLAFLPVPLLFPSEIRLPVARRDYGAGGGADRGSISFVEGAHQDVWSGSLENTSGDDRDQIQRFRQERALRVRGAGDRYAELPELTVDAGWTRITRAGQRGCEIGREGTRITQTVRLIQEVCRENRTDQFRWNEVWERVRELPTLNNRVPTEIPRFRHGVFRDKHELYRLLFEEQGPARDTDFRLKLRLSVR
jgi:hypothetical protein